MGLEVVVRRICITGGNGFIGGRIASALESRGLQVLRIPHASAWEFKFEESDFIVHCAGLAHTSGHDTSAYFRANFELSLRLGANAKKAKARHFIFTSSTAVFGSHAGVHDENSLPRPDTPYGNSKHMAEMALGEVLGGGDTATACTILRLPLVYGSSVKGNLRKLVTLAQRKIPLPLGSIKAKRSFLHIDNLCSAVAEIIDAPKPGLNIYNLSDAVDLSSRELYNHIYQSINGRDGTFLCPELLLRMLGHVPGMDFINKLTRQFRFPAGKFRRDYSWLPPYGIEHWNPAA